MSLRSSIQTGPNPWNEEIEKQHEIQKNKESAKRERENEEKTSLPVAKRKRTQRGSKKRKRSDEEKRNETEGKKVSVSSLPDREDSATNDSAGTVSSPTALIPGTTYDHLLKEFNQLRTKYDALRNRYQVLRNDATSRPPLNKRLKLEKMEEEEEREEEEEEQDKLHPQEDWFFILARL